MPKTLATIWREDGVINYLVPPTLAANTFLVLSASHSSWLCFLMEDMASTLCESDVEENIKEQFHVAFDTMRDGMVKAHNSFEHKSRMNRGTEDMFPNMVYGTMHPSELSALADDLMHIISVFAMTDNSDAGQRLMSSWGLWVEAAKKFVRPNEAFGPLTIGMVKE